MSLERFLEAQEQTYDIALNEIRSGRKRSHWMWFIFPQVKGLGHSSTTQRYAIQDRKEAEDYLNHPVLSKRLIEISEALLKLDIDDVSKIFDRPDDLKLKSSMTLFYLISQKAVFKSVLEKFFDGEIDERTVELLGDEVNSNIVMFPDFQKLKDEVEKLRTELSMLLGERDELKFVICKNIETEYMLELGGLEYKAYEAECAVLRLKRKIELIQAKTNRQEKIVLSTIEETLDEEFAEYQQKLNEQIEKMNEALKHSNARILSEEESKELKKIYRKIVKVLHPDLNPDVTEAQAELFVNAVIAYKDGDLATLRIINEMIGDRNLPEKHQDAMAQLMEERERLLSLTKSINKSIEKIKSEYPHSVKEILESPEKLEQRKAELQDILENYNELIAVYKTKLDEMTG